MYLSIFLSELPLRSTRTWPDRDVIGRDMMLWLRLKSPAKEQDKELSIACTASEADDLERVLAEARERRTGTPHLFPDWVLERTEPRRFDPSAAVLDPRDDPMFCTRCGTYVVPAYPAPFCGCRDLEPMEVSDA